MVTEPNRERGDSEPSPAQRSSKSPTTVEDGLVELSKMTERLSLLGMMNIALAGATFVLTVTSLILRVAPVERIVLTMAFAGAGASALYGLMFLYVWDRKRRRGMLLYEEISDELEWAHRTHRKRETPKMSLVDRPEFPVRLLLRQFLNAATLPLAPEGFGTSFYLLFYFLCVFLTALNSGWMW